MVWDFTMKYNENIGSYDRNGNIISLERFHGSWNRVDAISYAYKDLNNAVTGNRLMKVTDAIFGAVPVGFTDANSWIDDYGYDPNGNMKSDFNKGINGITYNHLNLPTLVDFGGAKGTIAYDYDAAGNKLQKTVTDKTVSPNKISITKYAGAFVYTNSYLANASPLPAETLEFFGHDEGRIRPAKIDPALPLTAANTKYIYDYFMKDHLGNTRMVLTTEQQTDVYAATEETANATKEDALFANLSSTRIAKPTTGAGFDTNGSNTQVSKLNGGAAGTRVGPSIILKVEAGDIISISTKAWYTQSAQAVPSGLAPLKDQLLSLLTAGIVANNGTHGGAIATTDINNGGSSVLTDFLNSQPYNSSQPKAFLNWIIVDEEYKKVTSSFHMGAVQVPAINSTTENAKTLVGPANMTVRRNGWLYVYLSNESNQDVYFDDLIINHKRGPVVEANNYYAFGLEIPGLNSKAIGFGTNPVNRLKFNKKELQSKEFSDGSGLEEYDFRFRLYDPQLGIFHNQDRLADKFAYMSPYQFCSNNPVWFREIDGLEGVKYTETDANGNKKTIVEKNVVVLTEKTKTIPGGASQKQIDRITKQNARIERGNAEKIARVQSELNSFYNGSGGNGSTDSKGNSVEFKFNVKGVPDFNKTGLNKDQIENKYLQIGKDNGLMGTYNVNGVANDIIAPAAVLTNESSSADFGNTISNVMRINSWKAPEGTTAHEVSHAFGLSDNGYTRGGILNSPPELINSGEIDNIINYSYDKK